MSEIKALYNLHKLASDFRSDVYKRDEADYLLEIADNIQAEIDSLFMALPLDADGVPIHVGDEIQFRNDSPITVDSIGTSRVYESDWGFFGSNGGFYGQGTMKNVHHVKPRTLEDVLSEFANRVCNSGHQWGLDAAEVVPQYADEIRELMKEGGE